MQEERAKASTAEIKAEVLERFLALIETIVNNVSNELVTFKDDITFVIAERFVDEHGDKIVNEIAAQLTAALERMVQKAKP